MRTRKAAGIVLGVCLVLGFGDRPVAADDYAAIDRWAVQYCGAAGDFISSLVQTEGVPKKIEMSAVLIQHYRRTIAAAETAQRALSRMQLPDRKSGLLAWARSTLAGWADYYREVERVHRLQQDTISSMVRIRKAAEDAIQGVWNANPPALFARPVSEYSATVRREAENLEAATGGLSPRTRGRLQACTMELVKLR